MFWIARGRRQASSLRCRCEVRSSYRNSLPLGFSPRSRVCPRGRLDPVRDQGRASPAHPSQQVGGRLSWPWSSRGMRLIKLLNIFSNYYLLLSA